MQYRCFIALLLVHWSNLFLYTALSSNACRGKCRLLGLGRRCFCCSRVPVRLSISPQLSRSTRANGQCCGRARSRTAGELMITLPTFGPVTNLLVLPLHLFDHHVRQPHRTSLSRLQEVLVHDWPFLRYCSRVRRCAVKHLVLLSQILIQLELRSSVKLFESVHYSFLSYMRIRRHPGWRALMTGAARKR
jgi:hypothetical protein